MVLLNGDIMVKLHLSISKLWTQNINIWSRSVPAILLKTSGMLTRPAFSINASRPDPLYCANEWDQAGQVLHLCSCGLQLNRHRETELDVH
ncbi:unnamed protein product [Mycena citricolor]|uniref:Uncharacterized protein n=1 Tax=Mycena citricolor TaxID=2018698 RepID=A0AAD2K2W8_9AGAR|nr:unnamed protein product [Mycena citricolor]